MKLADVKDRIDKFFEGISDEELFDLLVEEYGFPVEYTEVGEYEISSTYQQIKGDRDYTSWDTRREPSVNAFTLAA